MTLPERVWLMRHAETATPAVFHGAESDVGLSELGFRQAAAVAEWFRAHAPTAVVSSAMRRAIDTAAPIALMCGVPHLIEPELHERRVGILCGVDFAASNGPWAETVSKWSAGHTDYTTTGAESFNELTARVLAAWNRVIAANPGGRVVVVAHGVVCKALLLSLLDGHDVSHWSTHVGPRPQRVGDGAGSRRGEMASRATVDRSAARRGAHGWATHGGRAAPRSVRGLMISSLSRSLTHRGVPMK